ncbi:MAG: exo-alpha-sialidase [Clostridia bacterium]|nr:exo-alpha-sialidase [Clostridia bacterium]
MNRTFHLQIDNPIVIHRGEVGDNAWGHTQFPFLYRATDGNIIAEWEYTVDDIKYAGTSIRAKSNDGGKTWTEVKEGDAVRGLSMPNGKELVGFVKKGAYPQDYFSKYTPIYTVKLWSVESKIYFADDIKENEDKRVFAIERDSTSGEEQVFECAVKWPLASMGWCNGMVYPRTQTFAIQNKNGIALIGDALYCAVYGHGFNSDAKTREEAILNGDPCYSVYVLRSTDSARTWEYVSGVYVNDSVRSAGDGLFEGFCEPTLCSMPDGSVIMLMRSGNTRPSYIVRSTDKCKTWSEPQIFDDFGVFPQLLSLPCGVTIASYGRPSLRLRATSDPSGEAWEPPVQLTLTGDACANFQSLSCFYTGLLAISEDEALMIYSDFKYPNADGIPVKTILSRRIKVVFEE